MEFPLWVGLASTLASPLVFAAYAWDDFAPAAAGGAVGSVWMLAAALHAADELDRGRHPGKAVVTLMATGCVLVVIGVVARILAFPESPLMPGLSVWSIVPATAVVASIRYRVRLRGGPRHVPWDLVEFLAVLGAATLFLLGWVWPSWQAAIDASARVYTLDPHHLEVLGIRTYERREERFLSALVLPAHALAGLGLLFSALFTTPAALLSRPTQRPRTRSALLACGLGLASLPAVAFAMGVLADPDRAVSEFGSHWPGSSLLVLPLVLIAICALAAVARRVAARRAAI